MNNKYCCPIFARIFSTMWKLNHTSEVLLSESDQLNSPRDLELKKTALKLKSFTK